MDDAPDDATKRKGVAPAALADALRGRVTKHHRFLLRLHLAQIDALGIVLSSSHMT